MGNEVKNPNVSRLLISGIFAVAGGAIGGLIAGPAGAAKGFATGWQVGGIIGRVLIEDPREPQTSDYERQKMNYGVPIPILYGKVRLAGNIIACSVPTTTISTTEGGYLLPQAIAEYASDDFNPAYVDMAIAFCEGPISHIEAIYADEILIWRNSPLLNTHVAYDMAMYIGNTTQDIDPIVEEIIGIGKTPAYRGICYIRFTKLNLGNFNNNFPNITAVVVASGSRSYTTQTVGTDAAAGTIDSFVLSKIDDVIYALSNTSRYLTVFDRADLSIIQSVDIGYLIDQMPDSMLVSTGTLVDLAGTIDIVGSLIVDEETDDLYILCGDGTDGFFVIIPSDTLAPLIHSYDRKVTGALFKEGIVLPSQVTIPPGRRLMLMTYPNPYTYVYTIVEGLTKPVISFWGAIPSPTDLGLIDNAWTPGTPCIGRGGFVWWPLYDPSATTEFYLLQARPNMDYSYHYYSNNYITHAIFNKEESYLILFGGLSGDMYKVPITTDTSFIEPTITDTGVALAKGVQRAASLSYREFSGTYLVLISNSGVAASIVKIKISDLTNTSSENVTLWSLTASSIVDGAFDPTTNTVWTMDGSDLIQVALYASVLSTISAGTIIVDILRRSGLSTSDIAEADILDITKVVEGYCIARECSAAVALEPIRKFGFIDILEEDGKITAKVQTNTILTAPDTDKLYAPPTRGINVTRSVSVTGSSQYTLTSSNWVALGFGVGDRVRFRGFASDRNNCHCTISSFASGNTVMNVSNINDLAEVGSLLIVGATTVEVRTWVPFPLEEHEFGVASDTTSGSDTDQDNPELAIVETRVPELELPTRLSLTFATNDIKETEVTVSYSRNTHPLYKSTPVIGESSMDIPLVMSTSAAKHIVKKYLSRLWTERSSYEYTMGFRFTLLNVADVIEIPFNSLNQFVRITDVAEVSPNIRGYKAVEIHAQFNDLTTSDSADTQPSDQLLQRRAKTIGGILDTHVFRPSDDNLGWYTACYSYPPARPWEGANIKHGRFPILLSTIGSIAVQAAFGTLISDLPDNSPEGTFDESLIIQVQMKSNDTLTSHTFEEVLNGANLALIGNEFISFKTATLVAGKIYDLSGILRYRMGTKPLAGEHVYGERFIVVTPSTVSRILANSDDIGVRHYFKFVTDGLQAKNQTLLSQLFTGRSLICHAPSPYPDHYTPYDASKHHIYLCFGYVSRIGGDLVDGFDTPNSEPEANYEIDVYKTSDDTLLRTITATNHNIEAAMTEGASGEGVYFDDDQIADLGHLAVSEEVYFKIYQISAVMGRGYPLTITFYK